MKTVNCPFLFISSTLLSDKSLYIYKFFCEVVIKVSYGNATTVIHIEQKVAILCNANEKIYKLNRYCYYNGIGNRDKGNTNKTKRNNS